MPAKKQSKSRTSKNIANKKISAPRWVIAIVLLIVVGTGAFLVYNSFALSNNSKNLVPIYCNRGDCKPSASGNPNGGWYNPIGTCKWKSGKGGWSCPPRG